jgi:hypothetical protein
MRHGFDDEEYEIADIARDLHLTPEEVQHIEVEALRKLRWGKTSINHRGQDSPDTAAHQEPTRCDKQSATVGPHGRPPHIKDPTAA